MIWHWVDKINAGLFWVLGFFLTWQAYILLFHKGVPNISTAPAIQSAATDILKAYVEKQGRPITVIDLGSGDGAWTRRIAWAVPSATVIGLELAPLSLLWSRLCALRFKNLSYRKTNFLTFDMSQVDAVIIYQSIFLIEKTSEKLKKDLKPGALVLSTRYPLGADWQPAEHRVIRSLYLHQKDLFVYYR